MLLLFSAAPSRKRERENALSFASLWALKFPSPHKIELITHLFSSFVFWSMFQRLISAAKILEYSVFLFFFFFLSLPPSLPLSHPSSHSELSAVLFWFFFVLLYSSQWNIPLVVILYEWHSFAYRKRGIAERIPLLVFRRIKVEEISPWRKSFQ